jgi:hypothetical protein
LVDRVSPIRRLYAGFAMSVALAVIGTAALPISPARAGIITLSACNLSPLSQPFMPWLDPASYELAPGGDFENSDWKLGAGAERVPGSDPFAATGARGAASLELPTGASAQSPPTCVDAAYPTIRFFTSGLGVVAVSVVYGGLTLPAGVAVGTGGWSPTPVALTDAAIIAAASDGSAEVSLRFTTLVGDVRIDDVFIDPWNRG